MAAPPVRLGVVGIGFGQRAHVPAFRADGRCQVTAICANRLDRARAAADRLGVPKAYGGWRQLVDDPEVDVVTIATPPSLQPAIAIAALQQRKPVFCEKPLASTREAAAAMLAMAREAGTAHVVDFEFPMTETWQQAKALLDRGGIGQPRRVAVSWHVETRTSRARPSDSWKAQTDAGGGALNAFGSHVFYNLEWLVGPIRQLSARLWPRREDTGDPPGDTSAMLWLALADGTPASVSISSHAFLGTGHRIELYGEDGTLVLDNPTEDYLTGFRVWHATRKDHTLRLLHSEPAQPAGGDGRIAAVARLAEQFLTWVCDGRPCVPTFEHGWRVQCLLDAARQSDAAGHAIEVVPERFPSGRASAPLPAR